MRKAIIAASMAFALLLVAAVTLWLLAPRRVCPVTATSTALVQRGMSRQEVAEILGGPPGDYRIGSRSLTVEIGLDVPPPNTLQQWRGDEGLAFIEFDGDGRVVNASFTDTTNIVELSLWDRVLGLLGL
jgi:hypothetical protein